MKFQTYTETLEFLFAQLPMYQRSGAAAYKADLGNTLTLCAMLGNPEKEIPAIHIAGTNGKGSVSHLMASALMEQGYKTGLYTSPHLTDFRERIRINGKQITEEEVIQFVNIYYKKFLPIQPSFFEITFAMALYYFQKEKIQIAVIETGMGGRLDSTNVVDSVLSVITNIGHDHQQFLGNTLQKIAMEKAGIIKPHIPVVIGKKQPETAGCFLEKATAQSAPLLFAEEHLAVTPGEITAGPETPLRYFTLTTLEKKIPPVVISGLIADYQTENIRTACVALAMLQNTNFPVSTPSMANGIKNVLSNTHLRGRWQTIQQHPLTICDTGHNQEGIAEVIKMIHHYSYKQLHIVMGMVNDKEIEHLLNPFPIDANFYFCKADIPRSLPPEHLMEAAEKLGIKKKTLCGRVESAWSQAIHNAAPDDMIFIGGSTFVVADFLDHLGL
ncbi:MAG: bifunctional folylpolyglutamate synthase/dihydrofolate synthase [Bacteroidales bacterium]|nr:bifunctional folylpolyglutamate synthase/dihydrofolate synthase [Bacteroidales bacterium]HPE85760.1 folylpolyglutamate synthase/dihydrofolate synthase family protein [Bacteroidales bacterium]